MQHVGLDLQGCLPVKEQRWIALCILVSTVWRVRQLAGNRGGAWLRVIRTPLICSKRNFLPAFWGKQFSNADWRELCGHPVRQLRQRAFGEGNIVLPLSCFLVRHPKLSQVGIVQEGCHLPNGAMQAMTLNP